MIILSEIGVQMKKGKLLKCAFIIALIVWIIMLIKQQFNIEQYRDEIDVLLEKIEIAEEELNQNKQDLEQKKQDTQSLEYIEQVAREKLGMYLQNERVYVDSNI